jgi:hypothetical protein
VAMWRGHWDVAEKRLRELVCADADVDAGANAVNPLAFLGRILARRGDPAAGSLIDRAEKLAAACGEEQKLAVALAATVELQWLAGDADGVRAAAERFLSTANVARHRLLHAEVLCHLRRLGEPVTPFEGCFPAYAAGIGGDWAAAAALWLEVGNPYERAWELCAASDLDVVRDGLAILDRLGATAAARMIRRRLREAGVRNVPRGPRAASRANLAGLTDRQLEIVSLLRDGCTNGEIAERRAAAPARRPLTQAGSRCPPRNVGMRPRQAEYRTLTRRPARRVDDDRHDDVLARRTRRPHSRCSDR